MAIVSLNGFYSHHTWEELSAVMAKHLDWTISKCKRKINNGYKIQDKEDDDF